MTRTVAAFLFPLMWLTGCGEREQPRFIPATGSESAPSGEGRASDKASREATIPKNIETH